MTQAGVRICDYQGHLTPLQRQVLREGYLDIKQQEYEAQQQMMGGGQSSSPTSGSIKNGAASGGRSKTGTRTQHRHYHNPDGDVDPVETARPSDLDPSML